MSGKIHENSLPGSLKLRFSSPMVEKVEEEPVPVVPIWVWQVLFFVLCLTKNITEVIVDIFVIQNWFHFVGGPWRVSLVCYHRYMDYGLLVYIYKVKELVGVLMNW